MEINVGDNVKIKRGSRPTPLSKYESKIKTINSIPYPIQSDIDTNSIFLNKCKKYFRIDLNFKFVPSIKGDLLMTSSCDIGNVVILDFQEAFIDDKFFNLEVSKQISKSYLKYWLIKNKNDISNLGYGTTIKVLYIEPFKQYLKTKFLPALKTQQAIINIIEPFEKLQNSLKKKINTLEIMMLKIANQSHALGKMKNFDIDFEKGINIKSIYLTNQKTDKTFINVSAINNKPNKYLLNCEVIENINYGDVVLSLDGTIGLVNNFLKGVNGYGYKVTSNNIHNSIIYCSLIDERNKKIIQENSNGSVIKHSPNSKKELLLLDIQNKNVISFFNLQVIYKKTLNIIDYIIDKLINLCL